MAEVLVLLWKPEALELHRVPSAGQWQSGGTPIGSTGLPLPTRLGRFNDLAKRGNLIDSISEVFKNLEIAFPVWVLIPRDWVFETVVDNPDLNPPELRTAHLAWQVAQRLRSESDSHRLHIPSDLTSSNLNLIAIRGEILDHMSNALKSAGVEISGIGVEPGAGEEYNFDSLSDLREAIPLDQIPFPSVKMKIGKRVPTAVLAAIGVAVIGVAGFYLLKPAPPPTAQVTLRPKSAVQATPMPAQPATQAAGVASAVTPVASPADSSAKTMALSAPLKPPVVEASPLTLCLQKLPGGAKLILATASPMDLKMEVVGLANADGWLKEMRSLPGIAGMQIAGKYTGDAGQVTLFRLEKPGWKISLGTRDTEGWSRLAAGAGLTVRGRIATGSYTSALAAIDALWKTPCGFGKLFLAPEKGSWTVTVQ